MVIETARNISLNITHKYQAEIDVHKFWWQNPHFWWWTGEAGIICSWIFSYLLTTNVWLQHVHIGHVLWVGNVYWVCQAHGRSGCIQMWWPIILPLGAPIFIKSVVWNVGGPPVISWFKNPMSNAIVIHSYSHTVISCHIPINPTVNRVRGQLI